MDVQTSHMRCLNAHRMIKCSNVPLVFPGTFKQLAFCICIFSLFSYFQKFCVILVIYISKKMSPQGLGINIKFSKLKNTHKNIVILHAIFFHFLKLILKEFSTKERMIQCSVMRLRYSLRIMKHCFRDVKSCIGVNQYQTLKSKCNEIMLN